MNLNASLRLQFEGILGEIAYYQKNNTNPKILENLEKQKEVLLQRIEDTNYLVTQENYRG